MFSKEELKKYIDIVRFGMNEYESKEIKEDEIHSELILKCCGGDERAKEYVLNKIKEILKSSGVEENHLDKLTWEIYKKEYGLGVIHDLVENKERKYNNIECIDYDWIEVELNDGKWHRLNLAFDSEEEFKTVIRRAIQHDNKPDINEENALVESKRISGERITAGVKPVCYKNYLFIKLFNSFTPTEDEYLKRGSINHEITDFTRILFKILPSIAIIGGINRGKTTFLKYLIGILKGVKPNIKIGTLAPDFEIKLQEMYPDLNVVSLQESEKINLLQGFRWLLRANRDVIIQEEARGAEIAEAGKAARRGIGCTITTAHVIDPESLPEEFAQMHLESGISMEIDFLLYRYAQAFNITYRIRQLDDGRRIIDDISELVADRETRKYYKNTLFTWNPKTEKHKRVGGLKGKELLMRMDYYNLSEEEKDILKNNNMQKGVIL